MSLRPYHNGVVGACPYKKGVPDPDFYLEEEKWKTNCTADFNAEICVYFLGNDTYVMPRHVMVNNAFFAPETYVAFVTYAKRNMPHKILGARANHLLLRSRRANYNLCATHVYESEVEKIVSIFLSFQLNRTCNGSELPAQPDN
jgi:hypothetical protein